MKLSVATLDRPRKPPQSVPSQARLPVETSESWPKPGLTCTLIMKKMQSTRQIPICALSEPLTLITHPSNP